MTITDLGIAHELQAAGYKLHTDTNPTGEPRLWGDHTNGPNVSHVFVHGFGDFDQLVTADYGPRHETFTPSTAQGLIAAAKLAAIHVDSAVTP